MKFVRKYNLIQLRIMNFLIYAGPFRRLIHELIVMMLNNKRFKAKVPETAFRCFEDTGHFVPMERPDETAEAILDFLKNENVL